MTFNHMIFFCQVHAVDTQVAQFFWGTTECVTLSKAVTIDFDKSDELKRIEMQDFALRQLHVCTGALHPATAWSLREQTSREV